MADDLVLTGAMLIGAERVTGTGKPIHGVDPRSGETLEPAYGMAELKDVERAAVLAAEAFDSYRHTTPAERAAFLDTVANNIDAIAETLVPRVIAETGIAEPRVRGELARTTNQLRLFASVVREGSWVGARVDPALPDRTPLPRPDIRQRKVPVGPVAVFGASNFPLAFSVAGGDTASALAAGAPVVVKAHNAHPGTSELVGTAIRCAVAEHGLHQGVFSLIFGDGATIGTALVSDPRIQAVGFTGSRSGGLAIAAAAAARPVPIPVYAEMSSVNPVFVLPAAAAARGAELGKAYVGSLTTGVGQLCTNPGLVFVVDGPGADEFVASAAQAIADSDAGPMLNAGIQSAYVNGVQRLADSPEVTEAASGRANDDIAAVGRTRLFATSGAAFKANPDLREEIFGPASLVIRVDNVEEFEAIIDTMEGQLTATVHAEPDDHATAANLLRTLEPKVGRILFNGWPTGVEVGHAMVHGGPFPATSDSRTTSVGTLAIERFLRPVAYQNVPVELLPAEIDEANSLGIPRRVDGQRP
ncbi:aldehyde dehydrogenase (NADP(+)) [Saccharopolyspora phatthalungensis]|uniref:2,5-dioxovalerate dehydrogenase n=1 Tax=Saccharopolyspora phatthalungensis TaxID=664693 RepID=A0A840Q1J9_9PSEU|nr:aldehyde dehydrogenase (NADP(+)) [Saccharopolyspora phatthalungensis]MBB5156392.1 NADP-dependent aldehyde dehydrogenase [Saccharopolyspora phatthalungensis]